MGDQIGAIEKPMYVCCINMVKEVTGNNASE